MRLIYRLPVIALIFGLLLLGGCSSGDNSQLADEPIKTACLAVEDPTPPTPFDEASRLVSVQAEIQRLQCECAVQAGTYACVADCEADLFKLEPNGNAQCLRELFAANPLEAPMLDCNLTELEGLASCLTTASCNEDASLVCLTDFDDRLNVCPTGPGSLGDSFGIELSGPVNTALLGISEMNFPAARVVFTDQSFYPGASILPLTNLPTFTNTDVGSLVGGTLTNVPGAPTFEYSFDITSFTVAADPIQTFLLNYTATGTLTDTLGGNPVGLNGATLDINVAIAQHTSPDSTVTEPGFRQVEWAADADYTFTFAGGAIASFGGESSRLLAYDSFFDAALDSCLDLPGDQLAALYGESLDATFDQACRCAADETERDQCLSAKPSPRIDCLTQVVNFSPLAAEVTECLVEELDDETEFMTTQACCANPGDFDCLSPDNFSSTISAGLNTGRCTSSDEARDLGDAILACMRPLPVDFSDDPARCDNVNSLASGEAGDFMVVTRSQKLDLNGVPYLRHYLILDLSKINVLASIPVDAVQQFLFSLYLLDANTSNDATDQCEQAGIVSIALDDINTTADFIALSASIRAVQDSLDAVPGLIQGGVTDMAAYAEQLYTNEICPTFDEIIDAGLMTAPPILDILLKNVLLDRLGC